jgi:hypothetical protein
LPKIWAVVRQNEKESEMKNGMYLCSIAGKVVFVAFDQPAADEWITSVDPYMNPDLGYVMASGT